MTTFAKASFNAAGYAIGRPSYPTVLYDTIFKFHASSPTARWTRALDLGCGTGQATSVLAKRFEHAIGADPSESMIKSAKSQWKDVRRLDFITSSAETLPAIKDESVDLVTSAQAAHWFEYAKLWPELSRILKAGHSTAAFWCYSEFRLSDHPELTDDIAAYASDPSQNLGAYFERPGRSILERHLQQVEIPKDLFTSIQRVYFVGDKYKTVSVPSGSVDRTAPTGTIDDWNSPIRMEKASEDGVTLGDEAREVIIKKTLTWESLEGYFRTWSPLYRYQEDHPDDANDSRGDVVKRFLRQLQEGVQAKTGEEQRMDSPIEVEWPLALILFGKRS